MNLIDECNSKHFVPVVDNIQSKIKIFFYNTTEKDAGILNNTYKLKKSP